VVTTKEKTMATQNGNRRKFFKAAGALAGGLAVAQALAEDGRRGNADDFIRTVQRARIFDLSQLWDENSPIAGVNPPYAMALNATHAGTRGTFDPAGQLSFTSEIQQWSGQHGAPSIDAIGHIGHNGKLFGGGGAPPAPTPLGGRRRRPLRPPPHKTPKTTKPPHK
jgi:hypothetical protein